MKHFYFYFNLDLNIKCKVYFLTDVSVLKVCMKTIRKADWLIDRWADLIKLDAGASCFGNSVEMGRVTSTVY